MSGPTVPPPDSPIPPKPVSPAPEPAQPASKSASMMRAALWGGLLLGLAVTVAGMRPAAPSTVPDDALAMVNGQPVRRELFERLEDGARSDRNQAELAPDDRRRIVERLIDEELLVQESIRLGLASRDRMARGYLVQAMLDFVGAEAAGRDPSAGELESWYEDHRAQFRRPGRIAMDTMTFDAQADADEALARAREARSAVLAGEAWETVARARSDAQIVPIPRVPLAARNVVEYLGPTAARTAFALRAGEMSEPLRTAAGWLLLRVRERWEDEVPPLAEIRDEAEAAWRRAQAEEAVRVYVDELRAEAVLEYGTRP